MFNQSSYKIIGRSGAGSLIAEFLFREIDVDYEITFTNPRDLKFSNISLVHPQGKVPMLICPDQSLIYETLAIVNHITDRFNKLAPKRSTNLYDRYSQFLSLMATSIYSAYHRQHHPHFYVSENSFEDLRARAHEEQLIIYDYIEKELGPYICGEVLTAADFYLYMLLRWDLHKDILYEGRSNLLFFSDIMRKRPSIMKVLKDQPDRKIKK